MLSVIKDFFHFLFPYQCIICCNNLSCHRDMFCISCWGKVSWISNPFCICCGMPNVSNYQYVRKTVYDTEITKYYNGDCYYCMEHYDKRYYDICRSIFDYSNIGRDLILDFKYVNKIYLAKFLVKITLPYIRALLSDIDLIIPMPIHKKDLIRRCYNQSSFLVSELHKVTYIPFSNDVLEKHVSVSKQTHLKSDERKTNIINSMRISSRCTLSKKSLMHKTILLVDDNSTTESTINEASRILKKHFEKVRIVVLTLGRSTLIE